MTTPPVVAAPPAALRCSFAAELRGDPMPGTAAPAAGLLLVEQPGPWGRDALTESRLDPEVGAALAAQAARHRLRVLVIRRPGRASEETTAARRWAIVDCTPGRAASVWGSFGADRELLDLSLTDPPGTRSTEPVYLVCTHGRHDACCAIRGRPVAAALTSLRPEQVWECSHVGGDRFAANVLALPHGLYYGHVGVDDAAELVTAHERGDVLLRLLRGRTTYAPAVQAAEHYVRAATGETSIDALTPLDAADLGDGRRRVRLAHDDGQVEVVLRAAAAGEPAFLTCGASAAARPPTFVVESSPYDR